MPDWLLDAIRSTAPLLPTAPPGGAALNGHRAVAPPGTIPEGQRNATLTSLGGTLRRRGVGETALLAALTAVNAEQCDPPLPADEIGRIARSVARYAPALVPPGAKDDLEKSPHYRDIPLELFSLPRKMAAADVLASAGSGTALNSLPLLGQGGYIIEGWGHLLSGYPKAGKTELVAACVREWLHTGVSVVWLTEESQAVWAARLSRWPTVPDGLSLVFGLGADPAALLALAAQGDEEVVIVDTIRNLLQMDEADNTAISRGLAPWEAQLAGKTRIYVHHQRKAAGEHGQAIAGGAAFLGVADRAIELRFDTHEKNRRRLVVLSRIADAPDLLYEPSTDGSLKALGDPAAVALEALQGRLRASLSLEWQTTREVHSALGDPQPSEEQVRQGLLALAQAGGAERPPPSARMRGARPPAGVGPAAAAVKSKKVPTGYPYSGNFFT
ncbi:MAG: primase C-terminal domain-containing protein [Chloroflexi bacterium]|nr:primase C-terminal domain-containing protein [Chloroflexota bacterium]